MLPRNKMTHSLSQQRGFLMLVAVLLIVIVGFIGIATSFMFVAASNSTVNTLQSNQAFYLAESGLEQATHNLLDTILTNRTNCSGLTLTNTLGAGAYSVTGAGPFYMSAATTLNGSLTAAATTITVASTSGYQNSGRIMIDRELINYASVDGTHFQGVIRGVDGTVASSHTSGTRVAQDQCNLTSQGGVPSLTPTSNYLGGKRSLSKSVQLEDGWAVGNSLSGPNRWNAAQWNIPTEKQWTQQTVSLGSPQHLLGISIVSNVDVWAVGAKASALHFNGSTWTNINTGIAGGDNLDSVSAVSSQEAWACADQGKVYKWSGGASWTNPVTPGNNPNSISMIDANGTGTASAGWVVGTKKTAYFYNGSTWASANTGINVDLNSVSTLSATDAWTVGASGNIYHWNGSTWSGTAPTAVTLNGISMIKSGTSDIGWTVGASSTALYYNGSTWASQSTGLAGGLTLNSVVTVSESEAWTVTSNGRIYEWNGSSWNLVFTSSVALNGIDIVHANNQPSSAWKENF